MIRPLTPESVGKFELFAEFPEEERDELLDACEHVIYQPGEMVVSTGERQRALWLLVMGRAKVSLVAPSGETQTVDEIGPGSLIGEMSFMSEGPHSATVECVSACTFLRLDRVRFDQMLRERRPAAALLAMRVAETLAARLQAADQWLQAWLAASEQVRLHEGVRRLRDAFYLRTPATMTFLGLNT